MKHVFVCAEIGINHNGDLNLAKRLIDAAVLSGCDAVKFQKRTVNLVYKQDFLDSPRESPWGTTQREQKEGLEFGRAEYDEIDAYCKERNIEWYASAWDVEAQKFLSHYNLRYNKIASAMLVNDRLLEAVAQERKYTFIATGMSSYEEIDHAVEIFEKYKCPYELMHCISEYPMNLENANLSLIKKLVDRYHCKVGYSGHEMDTLISASAVAMGATSIERHLTLDRTMYGSDQKVSIEPDELFQLVRNIRIIEKVIGNGKKELSSAEEETKKKLRS